MTFVARRAQNDAKPKNKKAQKGDPLTPMEQIVLEHYAHGRNPDEIAAMLVCSNRTVQFHKDHIFTKLGVHNVLSMLNEARTKNLIPLDELDHTKPAFRMTPLEIKTLGLLAQGKTAQEMADMECVGQGAIATRLGIIYDKIFGTAKGDSMKAVREARIRGMIPLHPDAAVVARLQNTAPQP